MLNGNQEGAVSNTSPSDRTGSPRIEQRVVKVALQLGMVVAVMYGAMSFFAQQSPGVEDLVNFIPACILLLFSIANSVIWQILLSGPRVLSEMDPVTLFFLVIAACLMLVAVFVADEKRAEQLFSWSFSLATFVAGFESGVVRQKAKNAKTGPK